MSTRSAYRRIVAGLIAATVGVGLAACGATASAGSGGKETTVIRYQDDPGTVLLPQLAAALGDLNGIKLKDIGTVQGGPASLQAMITGQSDVGNAFNGSIAQLVSTGAPIISLIEWLGSSGNVSTGIFVKKDSPIHDAKQLIGKKVTVNTLGANAEAILDLYLQKSGLTKAQIAQVTLVPLATVDAEAALETGRVDAAWLSTGPALAYAAKQGGLRALVNDVKMIGPYNAASVAMRKSFVQQNPDTVRKFVAGMGKAMVYSQTHPLAQVRKDVQDWLIKQGQSTDAAALAHWSGTGVATRGGYIRPRDFGIWTGWLKSRGNTAAGSLTPSQLFTNKYNPYAPAGS